MPPHPPAHLATPNDMIRAVIFDFNGVLVDDEHVHFELLRDILADQGIAMTEEAYQAEYLGYDDRGCFEVALQRAGKPADRDLVDSLIERKASHYITVAERGLKTFAGAADSVRRLAERWPVAICSGALLNEIEFALERYGLRDEICAIVAAEHTQRCKPDPEGYFLALDALRDECGEDVEAGHCLVIEDSLAGIQAGKAAGMWTIGVTHTYPADALRHAGADAVLETLEDLTVDWVKSLFAPGASP